MDTQIKFNLTPESAVSEREGIYLQERLAEPIRDTSLPVEDVLRQQLARAVAGPAAPLFVP